MRDIKLDRHEILGQKKNLYKYNFLDFVFKKCLCYSKKRKNEIKIKSELLDNSDDFYDYYLDINTYLKKMIELDFIKLFVIKDREDLLVLDKFNPVLKNDYSKNYSEKIEALYRNKLESSETEELLESIRNMKNDDNRIFNALLSYYD